MMNAVLKLHIVLLVPVLVSQSEILKGGSIPAYGLGVASCLFTFLECQIDGHCKNHVHNMTLCDVGQCVGNLLSQL